MVDGVKLDSMERLDTRTIPQLDSKDIENSITAFKVHLMGNKQAHLGLHPKEKPPTPMIGQKRKEYATLMKEYAERIELWQDRRAKAFSSLYQAAGVDPNIKLVRTLYMKKCETENIEWDPVEFLDKCKERFSDQAQYKLKDTKLKFNNFLIEKGENLEDGILRLSTIILELAELGETPSEGAQQLAAKNGLRNGDPKLEMMSTMISMEDTATLTFERIKAIFRQYQANLDDGKKTETSVNHVDGVMSCSFCGILGHSEDKCRKKISEKK